MMKTPPSHIHLILLQPLAYKRIMSNGQEIYIENPKNTNFDKHFWVYANEVDHWKKWMKRKRRAPQQAPLLAALPPLSTTRWIARHKASVAAAIDDGRLSFEDACHIYDLSGLELKRWISLFKDHGVRGLCATHIQDFRKAA